MTSVFFDLDGTLIDTKNRQYEVYESVVNEYDIESLEKEMFWARKRSGTSTIDLLPDEVPDSTANAIERRWVENIEQEEHLRLDEPFPDTIDLLEGVKSTDASIWLVTARSNESNVIRQLRWLDLHRFFDNVIVTGQESKAPAIREQAQTPLTDGVLIGDTPRDILAAQELGLTSIAVTTGIRNRNLLLDFDPTCCFERLSEVKNRLVGNRVVDRDEII